MGKAPEEEVPTMRTEPDLTKVIQLPQYLQRNPGEAAELGKMHTEASRFLLRQKWCQSVQETYVGLAHPGVVAVLLFQILPTSADIDRWIWVVVGDLPPAYIASDDCATAAAALDGYIGEMDEWVDAVLGGRPVDGLIPVNVSSTKENALDLRKRLDFLRQRILVLYQEDL
jgi:hypothetical protein